MPDVSSVTLGRSGTVYLMSLCRTDLSDSQSRYGIFMQGMNDSKGVILTC